MKKKFSILLALVLAVSLLIVPAAVGAVGAYTLTGDTITVESQDVPYETQTKEAFDAEPETLVVGDVAYDAQSTAGPVTITGEVTALDLGAGWEDTAYVEIGIRPEATMGVRNAGIYLIAFNADMGNGDGVETWVHLQDYTGQGNVGAIAIGEPDTLFSYVITLAPDGSIGGMADLEVTPTGGAPITGASMPYGCHGTWAENVPVPSEAIEDFSKAHLFYSIIAECRGAGSITYSADVGGVTITGAELCSTVDLTATYPPVIGISVDKASVDFGGLTPGSPSSAVIVTVTNKGNVDENLSAEILDEDPADVYTSDPPGLTINGAPVADWLPTVEPALTAEASLVLTVPSGTAPGTYTATLVFWAEATPTS